MTERRLGVPVTGSDRHNAVDGLGPINVGPMVMAHSRKGQFVPPKCGGNLGWG